MLKKCFKYDFHSIFKIWLILSVIVVSIAVPAGFAFNYVFDTENYSAEGAPFIALIAMGVFMLYYTAIIVYVLATKILLYVRYYKHFFTDEGYLTFTLPVKRSTLFLSKILNSVLYDVMLVAVLFSSLLITFAISGMLGESATVFIQTFAVIWGFSGAQLILWIPLILVICALSSCTSDLFCYLCITLGAIIFKKHKVIGAVGIYYGSYNFVYPIFGFIYGMVLSLLVTAGTEFMVNSSSAAVGLPYVITLSLIIVICTLAAAVIGLAGIIIHCLERRLNLA